MTYHIPLLDEITQMFENEVVRYNVVGHLFSVYQISSRFRNMLT